MIDNRLQGCNHGNKNHPVLKCVFNTEHRAKRAEEEIECTDIDGAENCDQSEKVQPSRHPSREAVTEDGTPVIQTTGSRIGRTDLSQCKRKHSGEKTSDGPANPDCRTTSTCRCLPERIDPARENADDRERNRKIREAAHASFKFLRVPH